MSANISPISAHDMALYKQHIQGLLQDELKHSLLQFKKAVFSKFFDDVERATQILDIIAECAHDTQNIQSELPAIVHAIETHPDVYLHIIGGMLRYYASAFFGITLPATQSPTHPEAEAQPEQSTVAPGLFCSNCTFYDHQRGVCRVGWAQVMDMYGHTHSVAPGDPLPSAGGHLIGMLVEVEQPPDSNCKGFLQRSHEVSAVEKSPNIETQRTNTQEGT